MIEPGDCIISHPRWNASETVSIITEVNSQSTVALMLNAPARVTLSELVMHKGYEITFDCEVYTGGTINSSAMILLHDSNWYSSNTMPVNSQWSISSDYFMIDKLAYDNTPTHFRPILGVSAWEAGELEQQCGGERPRWLILKQPGSDLVIADHKIQYQKALEHVSAQTVNQWFT